MKRVLFPILTLLVVLAVCLAAGEVLVRVVSPTESLHPRYEFSAEYGMLPFANATMRHVFPGRYDFTYTVNRFGCRGDDFPAAPNSGERNIVVLGDSYTFGMGVHDGEEYPAVLDRALGNERRVINLGSPGWGLTQQVRRYADFGADYAPDAVVLQFCANDPDDNLTNRVARVEDGEIVFRDSEYRLNFIKKYLSRSFLQRSQLYNFFRGRASLLAQRRFVQQREAEGHDSTAGGAGASVKERVYSELLAAFAAGLRSQGTPLLMISVDGQLERHPGIRDAVMSMHDAGELVYLDVVQWLDPLGEDYRSPEGHAWGAVAHDAIGRGLAGYIEGTVLSAGGDR